MAQAAAQMGVSVDTVRRRLKAGTLRGRITPTKHGPTWLVEAPDAPVRAAGVPRAPAPFPITIVRVIASTPVRLRRRRHMRIAGA